MKQSPPDLNELVVDGMTEIENINFSNILKSIFTNVKFYFGLFIFISLWIYFNPDPVVKKNYFEDIKHRVTNVYFSIDKSGHHYYTNVKTTLFQGGYGFIYNKISLGYFDHMNRENNKEVYHYCPEGVDFERVGDDLLVNLPRYKRQYYNTEKLIKNCYEHVVPIILTHHEKAEIKRQKKKEKNIKNNQTREENKNSWN